MAALIKTMRRRFASTPNRDISQERLARLIGVSWNTVARWEKGSEPDAKHAIKLRRLDEVSALVEDLIEPVDRLLFFEQRHPQLNNMRPIDLLGNQYGFEAVMHIVRSLRTGAFM